MNQRQGHLNQRKLHSRSIQLQHFSRSTTLPIHSKTLKTKWALSQWPFPSHLQSNTIPTHSRLTQLPRSSKSFRSCENWKVTKLYIINFAFCLESKFFKNNNYISKWIQLDQISGLEDALKKIDINQVENGRIRTFSSTC